MLTVQQLQMAVEEYEEWERVRVAHILMQRAKLRLSLHEADAQIAAVHQKMSDKIADAIKRTK